IDVYTLDGVAIRQGEVLVLNQPLWRNINIDGLPAETIIPLDESGNEIEIDPGNLGDTVNLCIDDIPDGEV
ncbi:phage baseplate plug protein, partial [Lactiplantibacillus plantarum]